MCTDAPSCSLFFKISSKQNRLSQSVTKVVKQINKRQFPAACGLFENNSANAQPTAAADIDIE